MSIHQYSLQAVQIILLAGEDRAPLPSTATGFLGRRNGQLYLISNRHVFTGLNPITNESLGYYAAKPVAIKFKCTTFSEDNGNEVSGVSTQEYTVELYSDGISQEKPKWLGHPCDETVDVAVLDIKDVDDKISSNGRGMRVFDLDEAEANLPKLGVMQKVFIVGYPLMSNSNPTEYPIYKGATIASEPLAAGSPLLFLVDGKTKKGMSGSPVVVQLGNNVRMQDGKLQFLSDKTELIGIYSGRDEEADDLYSAELGRVWNLENSILRTIDQN